MSRSQMKLRIERSAYTSLLTFGRLPEHSAQCKRRIKSVGIRIGSCRILIRKTRTRAQKKIFIGSACMVRKRGGKCVRAAIYEDE